MTNPLIISLITIIGLTLMSLILISQQIPKPIKLVVILVSIIISFSFGVEVTNKYLYTQYTYNNTLDKNITYQEWIKGV